MHWYVLMKKAKSEVADIWVKRKVWVLNHLGLFQAGFRVIKDAREFDNSHNDTVFRKQ